MRIDVIKIGNSRGVILPKSILAQCHIDAAVDLRIENNTIIIQSTKKPREEWAEQFAIMAKQGDDVLLDSDRTHDSFDKDEWEW